MFYWILIKLISMNIIKTLYFRFFFWVLNSALFTRFKLNNFYKWITWSNLIDCRFLTLIFFFLNYVVKTSESIDRFIMLINAKRLQSQLQKKKQQHTTTVYLKRKSIAINWEVSIDHRILIQKIDLLAMSASILSLTGWKFDFNCAVMQIDLLFNAKQMTTTKKKQITNWMMNDRVSSLNLQLLVIIYFLFFWFDLSLLNTM